MAPRRSDYSSRKEYRWAKKVESRQAWTGAQVGAVWILTPICWLVIWIGGSVVLHALGVSTKVASPLCFVVAFPLTVRLWKGPLGKLGRAWDNYKPKAAAATRNAQGSSTPVPITVDRAPATTDPAEQIRKLAELHDRGAITSEEFESKKADLLSRI